jgi:hypothetical protein
MGVSDFYGLKVMRDFPIDKEKFIILWNTFLKKFNDNNLFPFPRLRVFWLFADGLNEGVLDATIKYLDLNISFSATYQYFRLEQVKDRIDEIIKKGHKTYAFKLIFYILENMSIEDNESWSEYKANIGYNREAVKAILSPRNK